MNINSYKQDEQIRKTSNKDNILRLASYIFKYKKKIMIVLACMLVTVGIVLINPILIEYAIDECIAKKDMRGLSIVAVIAIIINIIFIMLVKVRMTTMASISNKVLRDIRGELYKHIQKLSFAFFDSRPTGKILSRIIGDVNSLKSMIENAVVTLVPELITLVGVTAIMLVKDYRLALASLCGIPCMAVALITIQCKGRVRWKVYRDKASNLNAYIHERLAGMSVVKSFGAEDETKEEFSELVDEYSGAFVKAVKISDWFGSVVDLSWIVGMAGMYLVSYKIIGLDNVSIGTIVAFGTYVSMFWTPISNLSGFYNQMITNMAAVDRIWEVMDIESDIKDKKESIRFADIKGDVRFEHVTFAYDKKSGKNVLDDVSFEVKAGESIALIGETGAGKSTIVNLLSRFYDVSKGKVLIDGIDVRKVKLESLRSSMGVMTQENFIFQGTIRENIAYGKLDATDEEIIRAAKIVDAHDFIMAMEDGYDTELKEEGTGLSIGQRQLIALARTIVSDPSICILDEATSSIDTNTELMVQEGIKSVLKGRTSFIIAHRLSTIQNVDRIMVIGKGGILEQGSPRQLLEKKGHYYELYKAQFKNVPMSKEMHVA